MSPTRLPGKLPILALLALLATAAPAGAQEGAPVVPPSQREESRVTTATSVRRWAALGLRNGEVVVYDLEAGRRYQWQSPATSIHFLAIDPMGMSALPEAPAGGSGSAGALSPIPVVLLAAADASGRKTSLYVLKGDDGVALMEVRVPGPPAGLLVAPGQGLAYVFTGTPSGKVRAGRPGRWTLRVVDVTAGKVEATLSLTGTVHGATLAPDGTRIYVGLTDGIRSFTTDPLRSSWMLRSPGRNRLLRQSGPVGSVLAVRDSQLAILNPDNLPPRNPETGASPEDDALVVVDLPFIGRFMDVNEETGEAIVLDARGTKMATVDLQTGTLTRVQQVPDVAAAAYHPSRPSLLLFQQFAERVFEMLHNPPDRQTAAAEAALPLDTPDPEKAGAPRPAAGPASPAPPATAPETAPAAAATGSAGNAGTEKPRSPAAPPPPAEAEAAGSPSPEPVPDFTPKQPRPTGLPQPARERAVEEAAVTTTPPGGPLSGTITGETELVGAVVFFGPNAILKEHARLRPEADGSFSLPEPPPGRYRVVLEGTGGAQLRCSPQVRHIVVGEDAVGTLDFEVSGRIRARIEPR